MSYYVTYTYCKCLFYTKKGEQSSPILSSEGVKNAEFTLKYIKVEFPPLSSLVR